LDRSMEARKVMVLGKSSRVVALPKRWVDMHNIKKGDKIIFVMQEDGSLVMYPRTPIEKKPETIEIKVNPQTEKGLLERQLIAAYLNNYSVIKVKAEKFFNSEQQMELRNRLRKLTGLQIVEASSSEIIIQNLLELSELDIHKGIHRAHLITSSMFRDAIKAFERRDLDLANSVLNLDEDVNQFYFLIMKQLRCSLVDKSLRDALEISPIECIDYMLVMQRIEHIADHAKLIAGDVIEIGEEEIPQEITELILSAANIAFKVYQNAITAFFMGDVKLANHAINLREELKELKTNARKLFEHRIITLCQEAASNMQSEGCIIFGTKERVNLCLNDILDSIERIADYGTDIAEVAIDKALEQVQSKD